MTRVLLPHRILDEKLGIAILSRLVLIALRQEVLVDCGQLHLLEYIPELTGRVLSATTHEQRI